MRRDPNWVSVFVSALALTATVYIAYTSSTSIALDRETQKMALFALFEQEYTGIESRFPSRIYDPDFRPARKSDDYKRLEDYWILCYAEWYATNKTGSAAYHDLWSNYYAGHVVDALDTSSLRYVLIDMFQNYGAKDKNMQQFYEALRGLARNAGVTLGKHNDPGTH
jgi:hypothetical protein